MESPVSRIVFVFLFLVTLAPGDASAQGKGRKVGRITGSPATGGSAAPLASAAAGSSALQFGSWLDDASLIAPGATSASISFGYFRLNGIRQTDFPIVDAGVGLTPRVQFGVTVPYYRIRPLEGAGFGGVGDVYVSSKISLVKPDAATRRIGVALAPVVEILELPNTSGGKVSWGLPANLEIQIQDVRVFGSAGFFSRGAWFGGGAVELPIGERARMTGAITFSRSLTHDPTLPASGLSRTRSDATGVLSYFLTSSIAAFAGAGRTLGSSPDATSFMFTAGASFSLGQ
jgi:hypothetical protein